MTILYSLGAIGAVLYVVYMMTLKARANKTVADIAVQPKAEEIAEISELARLEQEIKDGKIDYAAARARLNELRARTDAKPSN